MKKAKALRKLISGPGVMVIPTAFDAISARRVEHKGFPAVHIGGFLAAASLLGMPDVGLISPNEAVTRGINIANAVDIPVVLDIDNGWGNAINVIRVVQDCVRGGIASIHIEDQDLPKRCGQFGNAPMRVVPIPEMVGKIRAAKDLQGDQDFVVMARTDALGAGLGVEACLERMKAYADAGADVIKVITRNQELQIAVGELWDQRVPLGCAPTRFASIKAEELASAGYKLVFYTEVLARASVFAVDHALDILAGDHSAAALTDVMVPTETLYDIVRLDRTREYEEKYVPELASA